MRDKNQILGVACAILGGACWGLSGCAGQYLFRVEGMDSRWLVPIRLGGASLILLVYSLAKYGRKTVVAPWTSKGELVSLIVYGLLGVSFCQFFYFLTIQLSTAAVGTILQDLSPIMILAVECLRQRRAPRAREIAAIVLALVGVALISTHGQLDHLSIPVSALVAGVLAAVCVTVYNIAPGELLKKYPITMLQGWAFLMGSVTFTLTFQPWTFNYTPSTLGVLGILFVVLVGNVLAFPLYMTGVRLIGPTKSILYGFAEPVTAAIIGTVFLGNAFTLWDLIGFVAVFSMLALISGDDKNGEADAEATVEKVNAEATVEKVPAAQRG